MAKMICAVTDCVMPGLARAEDSEAALDERYEDIYSDLIDAVKTDTKAQDEVLECFAGVGDPEPLRIALALYAGTVGASDDARALAIGQMVMSHIEAALIRTANRKAGE